MTSNWGCAPAIASIADRAATSEVVTAAAAAVVVVVPVLAPISRRAAASSAHSAGESLGVSDVPPSTVDKSPVTTPVVTVSVGRTATAGVGETCSTTGSAAAVTATTDVAERASVAGPASAAGCGEGAGAGFVVSAGSVDESAGADWLTDDDVCDSPGSVTSRLRCLPPDSFAGSAVSSFEVSSFEVCAPPELDTTTPGATSFVVADGDVGVASPASAAGSAVSETASDFDSVAEAPVPADGVLLVEGVSLVVFAVSVPVLVLLESDSPDAAHATPAVDVTAVPIPSATASAPTRPTYLAYPTLFPSLSVAAERAVTRKCLVTVNWCGLTCVPTRSEAN